MPKATKPSLRHVKLRLTLREAEALDHAVGNSLYSEEDGMAVMGSRDKFNAAWDAVNKLRAAMHAHREHARRPAQTNAELAAEIRQNEAVGS